MTRGTKRFISAVLMAIVGFVIGIYLVGIGEQQYTTSRGDVDMTDAMAISRAIKDPTFTGTFSWGSFTLPGKNWPLIIPFGGAVTGFISVIVFSRRSKNKNADN
ncbi:MAG: hypothetical protein AB2692_04130 [Candidatus Thiodiazotropha sp.]